MGLSAPLALLAAALIGLPIVAHLVRRADVTRRVLPTVALLRRVVVRDRRRARVTEPWLLALRIAAVIAATLALAGPFVVERLAYGDGSALSLVLVIDDSASMAQRVEDAPSRSALDAARTRAAEVLRSLGEGSEVAIVLAGSPARLLLPRTDDLGAARLALDAVHVGARRGDLAGALSLASRQLASARLASRRVLVLSDFATEETLRTSSATGVEIELVPIAGTEPRTNIGVADVRALVDPLEAGAWSVTVDLHASGPELPTEVTLAALALPAGIGAPQTGRAATELARTRVTLVEGHGRATLRFRPPTGTTSVAFGLVDHTDASPYDDVRVAALHVPRPSRVVFVEPAGARTARYATRALAVVPEEDGAILATAVDADHLAAHRAGRIDPDAEPLPDPLEDADVLVLAGVVPSSPSALETIRGFVDGGGGLLVAASASLRAIDVAPLGELLPARSREVREVTLATDGPRVTSAPSFLPPGPNGLEALAVREVLALDTDDEAAIALRLWDTTPLLVLDATRRTAVLAVGLDDEMSDLPLRPGFVPLLATLARTLSRPGALPDRPFAAGEAPPLRLPEGMPSVEIVTPTGEVLTRAVDHGAVHLEDLAEPGVHTIRVEEDGRVHELDRASLVLVVPPEEIDLGPHVPTELAPPSASARDGESRVPIERWAYLLVGLLAAIEGFARLGWRRSVARA